MSKEEFKIGDQVRVKNTGQVGLIIALPETDGSRPETFGKGQYVIELIPSGTMPVGSGHVTNGEDIELVED